MAKLLSESTFQAVIITAAGVGLGTMFGTWLVRKFPLGG